MDLKEELDEQIDLIKKEKDPLDKEYDALDAEFKSKKEKIAGIKEERNAEKNEKNEETEIEMAGKLVKWIDNGEFLWCFEKQEIIIQESC